MKKEYCKPDVFFEDFTLNTNIAAACEERPFNHTDHCGVLWGHSIIFTSSMTGCSSEVIDGTPQYNGLCYHNPSESYNVFMS